MQPRFPSDHHFHRDQSRADSSHTAQEFAALTERAVSYLQRQCLPSGDRSDPRLQPS
jgi:hypothetical protein